MEIKIKFSSAEDRDVFLKDSGENTLFALDDANDQLASGRTTGEVRDAKGARRGTWSLSITADDLRSAAVREAIAENGKAKTADEVRDLNSAYVRYVRYLHDCAGLVRESTIDTFLTRYGSTQLPEEVFLGDLLEFAHEDTERGPKHYLLRDDFREHLLLHDKLPEHADWIFDVGAGDL